MIIAIELIIILALIILFTVWKIWYKKSKKNLERRYKKEDDKGRKNYADRDGGTSAEPHNNNSNSSESDRLGKEQRIVQTEHIDGIGKDSPSIRKKFGIFGRRRK